MKKFLLLLLLPLLFAGCQKTLLGEEPSGSPEEVFETLWKDFDLHYSLFEAKGIDWDAQYATYRPRITAQSTQEELWRILCDMLEPLEDTHVAIYQPDYPHYYFNTNWRKTDVRDFFPEAVDLMLSSRITYLNDFLEWGTLESRGIGYIHLWSFDQRDYPIEDLDKLVAQIADCRAVIVDVRNNNGGAASYAWRLASWFSDNTRNVHYSQTRNGPKHTDFTPPKEHPNVQRPDNLSDKPVVLLTNSNTVSAAERFTLCMNTFANVTQVGTTTSGAYSSRSSNRFLPNGWTYVYALEKITLPDGSCPEGTGCPPDIHAQNNPDNWTTDHVLSTALNYLREQFGI